MQPPMPLDEELSDDELMELEHFLASPGLVESSLDVIGLDGFFAALLVNPRLVKPSEWMPFVWDVDHGEISPGFKDAEEAQRILGLVMRHYNSVARALLPGAEEFVPLFDDGNANAASNWCSGFVAGMRFESAAWSTLIHERPKWFAPILGLGLEEEDGPHPQKPRKSQIERWTRGVGPAVTSIHAYWLGKRQAWEAGGSAERVPAGLRPGAAGSAQAPGRNDLCPCGSGRKYKRCCGAGAAGAN